MKRAVVLTTCAASAALSAALWSQETASAPATAHVATAAPSGNPIRTARTGHVSNYDEAKVGAYTLPDLLTLANGQPVKDAETWFKQRRPELLKIYASEIYGRVPANAPKITWEVVSTEPSPISAVRSTIRHILGTVGDKPDAPKIPVTLFLPTAAIESNIKIPVILCINFPPRAAGAGTAPASASAAAGPVFPSAGAADPVTDILARGWGYANVTYTDIQPDQVNTFNRGVIGQTLMPEQTAPGPDEWGTISAWAWGISRIIDYFETDAAIDAKQIGIMGHSRLGKTVAWAGAQDPRIAVVYSSCAGEMGTALARRDWGESVDDMAQNFPWQFAGNFQKYAGHWNDLPVDAHMLIALNAPHPIFISGGTTDQWADPKGEFLAEVAAQPVYWLAGKKDLGRSELPPFDHPLITGDMGFVYHTGGHAATPADWQAFLEFAGKTLKTPLKK